MRVVFSWLREFVDYEGSPWELKEILTMGGLEVEAVEEVGREFSTVVVGEVLEVRKHPNADRLKLCRVYVGDDTLDIVCGASNVSKGMKVPVARVGTTLPGGIKIKRSKIRGVYSNGMILSGEEMGIEEKSSGIYELDPLCEPGRPISDYLPLSDHVLEVSVTPNRGDCLSILGIAREVSVLTGSSLKPIRFDVETSSRSMKDTGFKVVIDDSRGCFRYVVIGVEGLSIGPSPLYMRRRLELSGMRSISNVVDVTNYVMIELGQPLHAFDWDILKGGITVRTAREGETIVTLDGVERKLSPSDLLICDDSGPVAIAGVMGGENSEVRDSTTRVLIESACFNPSYIRATSKRLGLTTEASYRFSRGVDPEISLVAAKRAASLMRELAGGEVLSGFLDARGERKKTASIYLSLERLGKVLGMDLNPGEVSRVLVSLGFSVEERDDGFICFPPSWRYDVSAPEDVAEEIARVKGYDAIPLELPRLPSVPLRSTRFLKRRYARRFFSSLGMNEFVSYSFIREDHARLFYDGDLIFIRNPLSKDMSVMRPLIVPSLLFSMGKNIRFGRDSHRYFELRKVFVKGESGIEEREHVAILLSGRKGSSSFHDGTFDFFDLKGIVELFFRFFHIDGAVFEPHVFPFFVPGVSSKVVVGGVDVGFLGEVTPDIKELFELEGDVFVAELDLEDLFPAMEASMVYRPYSRFPHSWMDVSLVVEERFHVGRLLDAICRMGRRFKVSSCDLVDVYKGPPIPEGKKSVTIRIFYSDVKKTLTDDEIFRLHERLLEELKKLFSFELR